MHATAIRRSASPPAHREDAAPVHVDRRLADAGHALAASLQLPDTLRAAAALFVPFLADACVIELLDDEGTAASVEVAALDPADAEALREIVRRYPRSALAGVGAVLAGGEPVLAEAIGLGELDAYAVDREHRALLGALAPRSAMLVPLAARGERLGVLVLVATRSGRRYGSADLARAGELAARAATALDHARLYERARRATAARDEVLGIVAHDLRNPLMAVAMFSELLLDEAATTPQHREWLEIVLRSVGQIDDLIRDLLDASAIESGKLRVEPRSEYSSPLLQGALEMLQAQAAARGVELAATPDGALPPVMADRRRILQVLGNVLGNAVKFTPPGGRVTLSSAAGDGEVVFAIEDTGPGIDADSLPYLFDRFWQARQSRRGGAGLGLAIARGIVEAHGGRLWVESTPGRGSTFRFTLPMAPADADDPEQRPEGDCVPAPAAPLPHAGRVRVLVVDDHPAVRRGLHELMRANPRLQWVGEAATPAEAARLAGELLPDVVIMDLALEGATGAEPARRVLAAHPAARVLVLTGDPGLERVREALDAGASGYLRKSADPEALLAAVQGVANGSVVLDPDVHASLLHDGPLPGTAAGVQARAAGTPHPALSAREEHVLRVTAEGYTAAEIGHDLGLSPATVESYRARAMHKLGVTTRPELVAFALRSGWLSKS